LNGAQYKIGAGWSDGLIWMGRTEITQLLVNLDEPFIELLNGPTVGSREGSNHTVFAGLNDQLWAGYQKHGGCNQWQGQTVTKLGWDGHSRFSFLQQLLRRNRIDADDTTPEQKGKQSGANAIIMYWLGRECELDEAETVRHQKHGRLWP
jgi:hypothetical protein